jgi:gas vesicle protein
MKTLKLILSLGIATGAGLAIGVLTAPRKGKHTRNRIKNEIDSAKDSFENAANEKLLEAKAILNKTIENQKKNGVETAKKLKKAVTTF